jgi:hypothetical protein
MNLNDVPPRLILIDHPTDKTPNPTGDAAD